MTRLFGLIGKTLTHSFSKKYFSAKYEKEGITNCVYELFPLASIDDFPKLLHSSPNLCGLNVTIPYKQAIIPFLDELDKEAALVGAVNTIQFKEGKLIGYNTDVFGFEQSLKKFVGKKKLKGALILGTGGAAKAVSYVLKKMTIPYSFISRNKEKGDFLYEEINKNILQRFPLIINTTPLGTFPKVQSSPNLPYQLMTENNMLYDLVYNPEKTVFLAQGKMQGASTINGLKMLELQAEKAWSIWNNKSQGIATHL